MKKLMQKPIIRNLIVIGAIIAIMVVFGLIATVGHYVVELILSLGWAELLIVLVTALVCAVAFGLLEEKITGKKQDDDDDD